MANNIKLKRSAVAGKQPTTADLQLGELALNTYDGKLYTKKNDGTESIIQIGNSSPTPFSINTDSVSQDYTIPTGQNAISVGPVTVQSGYSVTVSSGQRWVVI